MIQIEIETHLLKRIVKLPEICTNCNNKITEGKAYYLEEGVNEHLHSLISRRFCSECYAKYGEKKLLGTRE
jgi:hypothetical protein